VCVARSETENRPGICDGSSGSRSGNRVGTVVEGGSNSSFWYGNTGLRSTEMNEVLTDNPAFTHSILGTDDPGEVASRLDAFCEAHLGSGVGKVLLCELGVGASFGLRLGDGRCVLLKAHPPGRPGPETARRPRTFWSRPGYRRRLRGRRGARRRPRKGVLPLRVAREGVGE
jgi:hypothetical protein